MSKHHQTNGQSSEIRNSIKRGVITSSVAAICFSLAGALAPAHACYNPNGTLCTVNYAPSVNYAPGTAPASPQNTGANLSSNWSNTARLSWAPATRLSVSSGYGNNTISNFRRQTNGRPSGVRRSRFQNREAYGDLIVDDNIRIRPTLVHSNATPNDIARQIRVRTILSRSGGNTNLQWSRNLVNLNPDANLARQINTVDVVGFPPTARDYLPALNRRNSRAAATGRSDVIMYVTPRIRNER